MRRTLATLAVIAACVFPATGAEPTDRAAARARRDAAARAKGLVVHEWGVVSYAQGLDAARTDLPAGGGGDDASDLPEFAQVWAKLARGAGNRDAGVVPGNVKIEIIRKPIVYFYTDRPLTVTFTVALPSGLITQWAPKAWRVTPDPAESAGPLDVAAAVEAGGSTLVWKNFDLRPPGAPAEGLPVVAFPPVPERATWWPICRDTDATPIHVNGQWERFLFYRGLLANVPPVVKVDGGAKLNYTLRNTDARETVPYLLMVHVAGGKAAAKVVPPLKPGETAKVNLSLPADAQPVAAFADGARRQLAEALEEAGLFPKEAGGMAKIWQKAWFEADGVRLIYLNPPGATNSLMPVRVDPRPAETVRTLLVTVECLKDSRENVIRELVDQLGDGDYATRESAQKRLVAMGKAAEPALRAALKETRDEEVRNRITRILTKGDPRAKIEAAEEGKFEAPGVEEILRELEK